MWRFITTQKDLSRKPNGQLDTYCFILILTFLFYNVYFILVYVFLI